jgi:hypothetical protein
MQHIEQHFSGRDAVRDVVVGMAVAVGEEPGTDCEGYAVQDQRSVADDKGWKNHEGEAAEGDGGAGGYAADDSFERGPD